MLSALVVSVRQRLSFVSIPSGITTYSIVQSWVHQWFICYFWIFGKLDPAYYRFVKQVCLQDVHVDRIISVFYARTLVLTNLGQKTFQLVITLTMI
jgi:hypothetical protein